MAFRRTLAILPLIWPLIWLGAAGSGVAQGFNAPPDSGPPVGTGLPQKPGPLPMPGQDPSSYPPLAQPQPGRFGGGQPQQGFGGPVQPGFGAAQPQPGFGAAQPQPGFGAAQPRPGFGGPQPGGQSAQQPARQNFADELTDFGVPPQSELQPNVGSRTPTTIPGGHVITTAEMKQAVGSGIVFVDVLAGPPHPSLPGAIWMPGAGSGGSFDDETQQKLWAALSQATQNNPNRPIAFLCAGSACWESYNAALRAEQMGFKVVLWYRGGLAAWQAAGLPMSNSGQGGGEPRQQGRIGFGGPQGPARGAASGGAPPDEE